MATAFPLIFRRDNKHLDLVRLGSSYGGWWVPSGAINRDSVCYCAGAGTDISFDLGLIETYGCPVYAFDPTPKSIKWISEQRGIDARFSLLPVGLGAKAGTERFYAPADPDHVSHSVKNIQKTDSYFEARVESVAGLMSELGHDRLDLLKLDIEGAEHDTIGQMLSDGIRPGIICVEYDQPEPLHWARATTSNLRTAGYDLVKIDWFNLTFVHRSAQLRVP